MKTSVLRSVFLAAAATAGFFLSARAAEKTVASGETLDFDGMTLKQDEYKAWAGADTTIVVQDGGMVTVTQGLVNWSPASGTFACNFRLEGENAKLVLKNWYAYKVLTGKISGNGIVECQSGGNQAPWTETAHTTISGDLSAFTGSLVLGDMQVAISNQASAVKLARVTGLQGSDKKGAGLDLGAGVKVEVAQLDGQIWVRGADGTTVLAVSNSTDQSQIIALGNAGFRASDENTPFPRLTVTNQTEIALAGGHFGIVEGVAGAAVRVDGTTHVYKPASNLKFAVADGGTLEFGNAAAVLAVNPALWLDASKAETLKPFVKGDKTAAEVDGHTVVRRWNDCRATQQETYGLNPYPKTASGADQISCFPYVLADACNGLSSVSFGDASQKDAARHLPFNKKVDVRWAVMVYSAQNKLTADGNLYVGGYCPDKDMHGAAGKCPAAFEGTEESEWSAEPVAYASSTEPKKHPNYYFSRGWNKNNILQVGDVPVWLDGARIANPASTGLSGGYQILTIDSRQTENANAGVPVRALGTKTDDGYNCGGQVYGEILLFSDDITSVQRLAVEAYLAAKWRVPGYDLAVGNVTVEEGGAFSAPESLFPNGIGLNRSLTFTADGIGAVSDPLQLGDAEADAYLGGTIIVNFPTAKPKAGAYRIISAKKINRLDPSKWTLRTTELNGRKAKLVWEKNAAGDCTGAYVDVAANGFAISFR